MIDQYGESLTFLVSSGLNTFSYNSTVFVAMVFRLLAISLKTTDSGSAAIANAVKASHELNGILCLAMVKAILYGAMTRNLLGVVAFFSNCCCLKIPRWKVLINLCLLSGVKWRLRLCFLSMCLVIVDALNEVSFSEHKMQVIYPSDSLGHMRYVSFHSFKLTPLTL